MRAERKSKGTIETYGDGVGAFLRWCEATGTEPELTRVKAQSFVADLLEASAQAATAHARLEGLRRFSVWLAAEDKQDEDPLAGMRSPRLDLKVVPALAEDQLKRLIKACAGKGLTDRRDQAIMIVRRVGSVAAAVAVAISCAPVAEASNEQEFLNAAAAEGYPNTQHTLDVGYQACRLMDSGMSTEAVRRYVNDSVSTDRSNPAYEAALFQQFAVYNLCPRHEADYGSNI